MATSLALQVALQVAGVLSTPIDVGSASYPIQYGPSYAFSNGSGANQAQKIWTDTRTINASSSDDLDLSGVLTDIYGNVLSLTIVKAIVIKAAAANVNDVVVGGAASNQVASIFNAVTEKIKVKPGGLFVIVAPDVNGYAVTAGTADLLRIANGGAGTSVDYTAVIVGV